MGWIGDYLQVALVGAIVTPTRHWQSPGAAGIAVGLMTIGLLWLFILVGVVEFAALLLIDGGPPSQGTTLPAPTWTLRARPAAGNTGRRPERLTDTDPFRAPRPGIRPLP